MSLKNTAVIFIGFQNDYFAPDGILRGAIEESADTNKVLRNTLNLVTQLVDTPALLVQTPILFTEDYSELVDPVGILKTIKDVEAFKEGTGGADVIDEFEAFGERIRTVPGKRGLNAFSNTDLEAILSANQIRHVVLAGAVTSVCIDSTGRAAHERGYKVTILSDCTAGRSNFEQGFYCENIFPLYAAVTTSEELITS
jgi:nicotinamidase-related amidase